MRFKKFRVWRRSGGLAVECPDREHVEWVLRGEDNLISWQGIDNL
jgi:hypothetical protein